MISVSNLRLSFGARVLFRDVNLVFRPGDCYGLIGANGAGKSTFLRLLDGSEEATEGAVHIPSNERLAVLEQNRSAYDDSSVLQTVIRGHRILFELSQKKDALYAKEDFSEEDGLKAAELEHQFSELGGWEAETAAAALLKGLGIEEELHHQLMREIEENAKVRVLLAQALFNNPDNLLLDEPTNGLDIESIRWLENFLYNFSNTVIVVSHDRHFLNQVCTHIVDIDYQQMRCYVGNYEFWSQSCELVRRQQRDQKKRAEDRASELRSFIQRFSANASRSRQATARRRELDKLDLSELPASTRRFPYVAFKPDREIGRVVVEIEDLSYSTEDEKLFHKFNLSIAPSDKIALIGPLDQHKSRFLDLLAGVVQPTSGQITWGQTATFSYFPADSEQIFKQDIGIVDWLRQHAPQIADEQYLRSFLGRMLFSGEDALKSVRVLSGGERVRCLLAAMMLSGANVLLLDHPTAHLDLEAIQALNNGLIEFRGVVVLTSHDHQFISSIANRIIEFTPLGLLDRHLSFDDYLNSAEVQKNRSRHYQQQQQRRLVI